MLSHDDFARYGRQILLAEVGREGQGRVMVAVAAVGGETLAHRVAVRYAERTGFAGIERASIDLDVLAPDALLEWPAAREVLAGARAATRAFRLATRDPEASR
jgi:hypothetical protein